MKSQDKPLTGELAGQVRNVCDPSGDLGPIGDATLCIYGPFEEKPTLKRPKGDPCQIVYSGKLDSETPGRFYASGLEGGWYLVCCDAGPDKCMQVKVECGCTAEECFTVCAELQLISYRITDQCEKKLCEYPTRGGDTYYELTESDYSKGIMSYFKTFLFEVLGASVTQQSPTSWLVNYPQAGSISILYGGVFKPSIYGDNRSAAYTKEDTETVRPGTVHTIGGQVSVRHLRSRASATNTFALWTAIRNRTKAISFSGSGYKTFIDRVLCQNISPPQSVGVNAVNAVLERQRNELSDQVYGTAAYDLLKTATEVFLLLECGVKIKKHGAGDLPSETPILDLEYESKVWDQAVNLQFLEQQLGGYLGGKALPYIERVIAAAFPGQKKGEQFCEFVLTSRATDPCFLELIWNYWHEEGMLVQSINAISRRFQNVRAPGERDPLAHLEIDPLRPLNNILWGYVEDERSRLSVKRRVYEYHHHYGLNLYGKAVPDLRPADNRSKFLEAFHNLLHTSSEYFKAVQDTTVVPDGYPLLHALKEVHLILAQGAHNQFGDLPWTARVEMLMQQWILARPEIRDFLQSRAMVPYREGWMPQVDTMKTLQGWSDVTITHFRDLGVYGEQILLSIRYHNWNDINDEEEAKGWADSWRPELQGYLHAYRAVTGVDLSNPDTVDYTLPSVHLRKRLSMQQRAR